MRRCEGVAFGQQSERDAVAVNQGNVAVVELECTRHRKSAFDGERLDPEAGVIFYGYDLRHSTSHKSAKIEKILGLALGLRKLPLSLRRRRTGHAWLA
jgi:hypothetical protein